MGTQIHYLVINTLPLETNEKKSHPLAHYRLGEDTDLADVGIGGLLSESEQELSLIESVVNLNISTMCTILGFNYIRH